MINCEACGRKIELKHRDQALECFGFEYTWCANCIYDQLAYDAHRKFRKEKLMELGQSGLLTDEEKQELRNLILKP